MRAPSAGPLATLALILAGCGAQPLAKPDAHLHDPNPRAAAPAIPAVSPSGSIPAPVRSVPMPPPPQARATELKYSVVVANQPVREVLLAMARETQANFDIHPGIEGSITLNAIDQTLKQILTRIGKQVDMRWEADGTTISVMPDSPFLRTYRVDYVNMARDVSGTIGIQSQVVGPTGASGGAGASQNSSLFKVENSGRNRFWETLEKNLKDLLRETDKLLPEGSSETFVQSRGNSAVTSNQSRTQQQPARRPSTTGTTTQSATTTTVQPGQTENRDAAEVMESRLTFREAASVIVNSEAGIVTVRASSRQQERVADFLEQVSGSVKRQVLIEATVVEVLLDDNYQAGVDWSALALDGLGYSFRQNFSGANLASGNFFGLTYSNPNGPGNRSITSSIKALETFGKTRVLSSPKIMALNNQTAVLKVVNNHVYFSVKVNISPATLTTAQSVTYSTDQNVVPVGFVMNVTPQIADNDVVVLNVRPTVSRIIDTVEDPNPELRRAGVKNLVPIIQSREFESVLRIPSGQTAILGGLMEDSFQGQTDGLPILSRIPVFGDAVAFRNDRSKKSELVIFLRPFVVRDASLETDLAPYRRYLPDANFFRDTHPPLPAFQEQLRRIERGELPEGTANPVVPEVKPAGSAP